MGLAPTEKVLPTGSTFKYLVASLVIPKVLVALARSHCTYLAILYEKTWYITETLQHHWALTLRPRSQKFGNNEFEPWRLVICSAGKDVGQLLG